MQGGAATDSLDPAAWASQVPYFFGRQWGEQLVQMSPDRRDRSRLWPRNASASDDAKTWTFKIRKGVAVPQRQGDDAGRRGGDHGTPCRRELEIRRARHHAAASQAIKADGQNVVFTLKDAECRPALSARRLSPDDPAEWRQGQSDRRHRHRALQGHGQRARRAAMAARSSPITGATTARPCRPDRDHRHQRRDGAHLGAAGRPGPHDQPRRAEDRRPDQARAGRHHPERRRARATMSSSPIATPRRSTTTISGWR